jgi:ComF family protein
VPIIQDLIHLLYPRQCVACGKALLKHEECVCSYCLFHLPKTNYHLDNNNDLNQLMWGKAHVENITALYFYHKGNKVQELMYGLKYRRKKNIGLFLGEYYGKMLLKNKKFAEIDYIVPIPLHPSKLRKRGYNQSEMIGRGMEKGMKKEMLVNVLVRKKFTETQTKKSRMERWENVESVFALEDSKRFNNKHILLVDDVITTGSTMEACVHAVQKAENVKVSVVCLACAKQ